MSLPADFEERQLALLQQLGQADRHLEQWDSIVAHSTQTFSAIANVCARRNSPITNTLPAAAAGALEPLRKLEKYMGSLQKALGSLRDLADKLVAICAEARGTAIGGMSATVAVGAVVERTAVDGSFSDILEYLELVLRTKEREYWNKKQLLALIDYNRPEIIDGLMTSWAEDPDTDRRTLQQLMRRAHGTSLKKRESL